ncbi:protein disulfide-isomerase precursor [Vanrija albida]|uniref:Protein disulfide-isomerase n=1 Tax=Vanrija albida TaxID=181172 RepID=A0ABR3Q2J7_9TREE
MKLPLLKLLALLPAVLAASDVIDLTKGSFKGEIDTADLALVEFFAPWCGHCKNLAPEYEEAATILKKSGIKLAKVDCTEEQDLCQDFEVSGYPTLKVFRNGTPTEYNGPRKADGIVSYMNKQNLPAVTDLTAETHDDFTTVDKVVVIAYGDKKNVIPESFTEYANSARDNFVFGKFEGAPPASAPKQAKAGSIVLYRDFDDPVVFGAKNIADVKKEDIAEWVKTQSLPIFAELGPENFGSYAEHGLPIAYLFADPEDVKGRTTITDGLKEITSTLRGLVNFVWIDGVKFAQYGASLGAKTDKLPVFLVQNLGTQSKYILEKDTTAANIEKFVKDVVDGVAKPFVKSEPLPESQDGPVYHLTNLGWNTLFDDKSKDIFVEFYAPWCGHCQRLAPIWDQLGEEYKGSNVVIAKMDAQENDLPADTPFQIQGFPTLKFRAAGTDEFIDYNGDRSLESLQEFIIENGKTASAKEKRAAADADVDEELESLIKDTKESKESAAHDEL